MKSLSVALPVADNLPVKTDWRSMRKLTKMKNLSLAPDVARHSNLGMVWNIMKTHTQTRSHSALCNVAAQYVPRNSQMQFN